MSSDTATFTNNCEWTLVTAPAEEPLTLAQAKLQARIPQDLGDEDALVTSYIVAARQAAEQYMGRGLFTQTWKLTLDYFSESMWLPMASPLASVTSVKYYDVNGTLQTLSSTVYTVDTTSEPGRIVRAPIQTWPALQGDRYSGRVEITYVVGWTAPNLIPELIKQGCRLYVTYCDRDRYGMPDADASRKAAEACWRLYGRVFWKKPTCEYADMYAWTGSPYFSKY